MGVPAREFSSHCMSLIFLLHTYLAIGNLPRNEGSVFMEWEPQDISQELDHSVVLSKLIN